MDERSRRTGGGVHDERDFLVASLEDLDRELEAGDLDPRDHGALRDDYTRRLASTLRELSDGTAGTETSEPAEEDSRAPSTGARARRRLLIWAGVLAFAVIAGVLVAQAAGSRGRDQVATGDIRSTVRQRLADCLELAGRAARGEEGALLRSLQCYDAVLEDEPGNVEALTYKGWALVLTREGPLVAAGADYLDEAILTDPAYPDARAFRAVVRNNEGRLREAKADLDALDELDASPMITDLLSSFALRERIEAGLEPRP